MAFLKFNKSELVNLSYSLKREIILGNKTGAYCNTSIVACNTRRYHGLLAVTLDRFGGDKFLLLSALDDSIIVNGKQFNLGIHCYGDVYEPRGHKYVTDFTADPIPQITYKIGEVVIRKSLLLVREKDQVMIRFELLKAPSDVKIVLKPFLAFRNIHALTQQNSDADTSSLKIDSGVSFCMYPNFPYLHLQLSNRDASFHSDPVWYKGVTYSDEYRRGFDCREDLMVPGWFEARISCGSSLVFSGSIKEENAAALEEAFAEAAAAYSEVSDTRDQLVRCADILISDHNGRRKINAGFSWLYPGLLRETLISLPGLALYGKNDPEEFEAILDILIADNQERLTSRTTQVEAPLYLASTLQRYIEFGADPRKVWKKYGPTVKSVIESYLPGRRKEITMHPNGLLWAQMDGVALSWMNAYVYGRAVTERAGYQVETNALWYNSICFAIEMEGLYGKGKAAKEAFNSRWTEVRDLIKANYQKMFWDGDAGFLADYIDNEGRHMDVRPNQLLAIWVKYSPVDEELAPSVLRIVDSELVTGRGIRTLSPRDARYKGVYEGSQIERDLAYHQGCTAPFLLEQYVEISFRVKGPSFWKKAEWLSEGFYEDLSKHGVGAFSELYDGDPPHEPHGAISSAMSTAALLVVNHLMDKYKEAY